MALPISVIVTGEYFKPDPEGMSIADTGYVLFVSQDKLHSSELDDIAGPFSIKADLVGGKFSIAIPSNTDPSWSPTNGTYLVKEVLSTGVNVRRVVIPHDAPGGTLDMADIPDVSISPDPNTYVYRREVGALNGIAPLGSDGLVPDSFLPPSSGGSGIPDATSTVKGGIRLTGDLGGTALSPTVPGLASKAAIDHTHEDSGGSADWDDITGKPATFPPSGHSHAVMDVTGLQALLDDKQPTGSYAAASHTHTVMSVTGLQALLDDKASAVHTHAVTDTTGLQAALDGKQPAGSYAASVHTHVVADTTGLQAELDGKAATVHSHAITDTTGLQAALDGKQAAGSYAASGHTHQISAVVNLQSTLDGKQAAGSYAAASHTHTASQVTDLAETVDDRVAGLLVAGTNVSLSYNDAAGELTISATAGGGGVSSVNTRSGAVTLDKSDVGLSNVDNTADSAKPVSAAQQTALDLKAPLASPAFTGTPTGITKTHVGLGNVDNTTDSAKPVSTAQQTALDLKAPLASPTFTGTVSGITKTMVGLGNVDNTADSAKPVSTAQQTALNLKAPLASPTFTGTVAGITKAMVGLSSVDNTADSAKPVSTAQQTALDLKAPLASPTFTGTVSGVTKAHVGLGSVDNTADTAKPVSTAQQTALDGKLSMSRTLATNSNSNRISTNLTYSVSTSSADYEQISVSGTVVCWRNEIGLLRATPHAGYKDDAMVRGIPRSDLSTENGGYIELENSARTQILHKRSWRTGALWRGNGTAAAVQMADVLVLATGAAVPSGTPAGTVIVRTP